MSANGYLREIPPSSRHPRKRYQAVYRDASGRQRSAGIHDTRREAREALAHVVVARSSRTWCDPAGGRTRLADYGATWLAGRQVAESTQVKLAGQFRTLVLPTFGHCELRDVEPQAVRAWVADLSGRYASSTVRDAVQVLRGILDSAVIDGLIPSSPVVLRRGDLPRVSTEEGRFLTVAELDALIAATPPHWRAMVHLAAWTGMRFGECAGLQWSDVDLQRGTVYVRQAMTRGKDGNTLGPTKTASSRRLVTLDDDTVAALLRHQLDASRTTLAFPTRQGRLVEHSAFVRIAWQDALKGAYGIDPLATPCPSCTATKGQKCRTRNGEASRGKTHITRFGADVPTFHDLRHSHVSHLLAAGMDPITIAKRVGHSSPVLTTTTYAHLRHDHVQAVRDALSIIKLRELERV